MKLSQEQHHTLVKYLKDVGIRNQEPFEEFYDHVVTAFEKSDATDISLFIKEAIEPAFGGEKGIQKILKEGSKSVTRHYRKVLRKKMAFYFKGPNLLIPISMYFALYMLLSFAPAPKMIFFSILVLTCITPFIFVVFNSYRSYRSSKRNKLSFYPSLKREELHRLTILGMLILHLHNIFLDDIDSTSYVQGLIQWLPLVVSGLVIYIIWAISCVQMVKEELTNKLIIQ
jgi:hypothetical protein